MWMPSDCNDGSIDISPAATEVCDGIDNDCDGLGRRRQLSRHEHSQTYYSDADGDGYGDPNVSVTSCVPHSMCWTTPIVMMILLQANRAPNVAETCDFVDNDCDGVVDAPGTVAFFPTAGGLPVTSPLTGTSARPDLFSTPPEQWFYVMAAIM